MGKLENKVAIVTGAAQGMGESHARTFLKEGAKVVILKNQEHLFPSYLNEQLLISFL